MNAAAPNTMDPMDSSARDTESIKGKTLTTQPQPTLGTPPAHGPGGPNFNTVIADIINHGETVDNHYASSGYNTIRMVNYGHLGASFTLKTQSLSVLENLVGFQGEYRQCGY